MSSNFKSAAHIRATALAFCALLAAIAPAAAALVEAIDDTILTNRGDGPYTVGFDFTVDAGRTINALGVEDSFDDGLEVDTEVGLWDITEFPSVEIARVLVPAGTAGTLEDGFRYTLTESEITLEAGRTYRIGAVVGNGIAFTDTFDAGGGGAGFSGAGVNILANRFEIGGTLAEPIRDGIAGSIHDVDPLFRHLEYAVHQLPVTWVGASALSSVAILSSSCASTTSSRSAKR